MRGARGQAMLDTIRTEIAAFLAAHNRGTLCLDGAGRVWAMPVPYRAQGLQIACCLPHWADGSYYIEIDPHCVLIIPATDGTPRWASYAARALVTTDRPGWPVPSGLAADFYTVLQLHPVQIDLFDERRGWGARQTLEPSTLL